MASEHILRRRTACITTQRSDRGYSCKVQQMVKRLEREGKTSEVERETKREKHEHRNWKQVSQRELDKMGTVARSRYLAYEPPSKEIEERQQESVRRVRERCQQKLSQPGRQTLQELVEREKDSELIGQIKAAEARHRIKLLRDCYEMEQDMELRELINNQPTSVAAVRLKTLLKPHPPGHTPSLTDPLTQAQRKRCELLIENDRT